MDLDAYRQSAESFVSALDTEFYRHYAGLQDDYAIEPIYDRHAELFTEAAVLALRELTSRAGPDTDERRRLGMLLDFAVDGYIGQATKAAEAEVARVEAGLTLELDGERIGFRRSSVVQANEPDAERRAEIEAARMDATSARLTPLQAEVTDQRRECARRLGWPSYLVMCEELKGIDLAALATQTAAFLANTEASYGEILEPQLRRTLGLGAAELRRSDLPRFFRAPDQDEAFPADRLLPSFLETMDGLGIDVLGQEGVFLDVEPRENKSPRAFCAPVHAPGEVYLAITPVGGRDDFAGLLHEGGHTEHFANVDPTLPFEYRHLGDHAITECYAFLFQHLLEDGGWLRARLGIDDPAELLAHARAHRLIYLRRYAAKLAYEIDAFGDGEPLGPGLASRYADRLGSAVGVEWPAETFLTDIDPGFYCACYLRAWALETHLRGHLRERYGPAWFESPGAGEELRALWREGQRSSPEELLARLGGGELDFGVVLADVVGP